MRKIFLIILFLAVFAPQEANAHQALFVEASQHEITTISDTDLSQAFYGKLDDFPHLFEFTITEPQTLFAEILIPDIEGAESDVSGIILKIEERGVTEIKRLNAKEAAWESFYEFAGGDSYKRGPSFYDSLEAGTYQIEISTPVNLSKYVLVVGKREEFALANYFGTVRDIARIKSFFEKPKVAILQSPFVYIPLVFLLLFGWITYRRYMHRTKGLF